MKINVNHTCCICGQKRSNIIYILQYPEYNYPGSFIIRKCLGCGLLFNSPRLSNTELYNLYNDNYYFFKRRDAKEFRRILKIYQRTLKLVENKIQYKKVLEIGSGKGYLLALILGLNWKVQGIEISSTATQYAKETFGVSTFTGTVENYAYQIL